MPNRSLTLAWLLAGLLLGTTAQAALQPPPGYFAAAPSASGKSRACAAAPRPYTGTLQFRSKYEGSDQARATLNPKAEKAFHQQTAPITELERGVSRQVGAYLDKGDRQQLRCALDWLGQWAEAGALLSTDYSHTGKSMRKWALGSVASAYLRLKFSRSRPLAAYPQQAQLIETWLVKLAEQSVRDWSDLPPRQINNHSYWAAWAVMAAAVASDRRDLFDWAIGRFRVAASQVDADGYLANELKRKQRALAYHNYSLPPLAMVAAFAQANGVDLRPANGGALQRLAERVLAGAEAPAAFTARAGAKQDLSELHKASKFAWLAPYCSLYACSPATLARQRQLGPFNNFRLGGNVSQLFAAPG